jgi:hypothetical protein
MQDMFQLYAQSLATSEGDARANEKRRHELTAPES